MSMEMRPCILMVEDEAEVLRINARMMRRRGYEVMTAASCQEARACLSARVPDLLILDIMLPDGSGLALCEDFRRISDHPVIFLTGKNEVYDKILGLEQGGDYYLTKPYDPEELMAVAARLLQRHIRSQEREKTLTQITKGALTLDIQRGRALVDGQDAGLTAKEFALLLALVRKEDREVSPRELYETVWGAPSVDDVRTIRTHVKNLRRKLQADDAKDYDIVSAYGKGYTFTTIR